MDRTRIYNLFFGRKIAVFFMFLVVLGVTVKSELGFLGSDGGYIPAFSLIQKTGVVELIEKDGSLKEISEGSFLPSLGQNIIVREDSEAIFEVNGLGTLALDANTKLRFDYLGLVAKGNNEKVKEMSLYLESGHLWINNLFSDVRYNLFTNRVLIVPDDAQVDVSYNGSLLTVYNHTHDVYVALLSKVYVELKQKADQVAFYNSFFLPEGNKVDIAEGKINEKLAKLLLSKLVKEFPIQLVLGEDVSANPWYNAQLTRDSELKVRYMTAYMDRVGEYYALSRLPSLQAFYMEYAEQRKFPFIISEQKKVRSKEIFLRNIFGVGQKWALAKDARSAETNSEFFYSLWARSLHMLGFDARNYLTNTLADMNGVSATHILYQGKERVWDEVYLEMKALGDYEGMVRLLSDQLQEMYDLMDEGEKGRALEQLTLWSGRAQLALGSSDISVWKPLYHDLNITRRSVVNLFFRYAELYSDSYFEVLTAFDQKVLEMAPDQIEQEENRQSIIQERIKILKKLSYLIETQKIDASRGIDLGKAMMAHVELLRSQALYRVAIYDFFDKELAALALRFEFYESPEYRLLRGGFDEAFKEFVARREDWAGLQNYIKEVRVDKVKVKRVNSDNLIAEVYGLFTERSIYPERVGLLGDERGRLYLIEDAKAGNVTFSGKFDRETELLFEIQVGDMSLEKGVHIDRVRDVVNSIALLQGDQQSVLTDTGSSTPSQANVAYSSAEELAMTLAVNELNGRGFFVNRESLEILDLLDNRFYVKEVALENFSHTLSFEFDNTRDKIQKVMVRVSDELHPDGKDYLLEGEFTLEGIHGKLTAVIEAVLDTEVAPPTGRVKRKPILQSVE